MGSLIREGLWLGSLDDACNTSQLQKQGVTHILSIEFRPLPSDSQKDFGYKFIHALDMPDQDLLSHFQECFAFIDEALGCRSKTGNGEKNVEEKIALISDEKEVDEVNGGVESGKATSSETDSSEPVNEPTNNIANDIRGRDTPRDAPRGGVLVHCFVGFSRSATIVIAYLMQKERLSFEDALASVKALRSVGPNPGFREQLELFERMDYVLDKNKPEFRAFCLNNITGKIRELSFVQANDTDMLDNEIAQDTALKNAMASDPMKMPIGAENVMFKCRKCRRPLARGTSSISHPYGRRKPFAETPPPHGLLKPLCEQEKQDDCTMGIFIEPVEWMQDQILTLEGKLSCPKCKAKIGNFTWVGQACPCGRWMVPAFHLAKSKIDKEFRVHPD